MKRSKDKAAAAVAIGLSLLLMLLAGCDHSARRGSHRRQARPTTTTNSATRSTTVVTVRRVPRCGPRCRHTHRRAKRYGLATVPAGQRHWNYGGGSCVYASVANTLEILGLAEQANHITAAYSGGEDSAGLHAKLDQLGWDYAATTTGDEAILDWCDRTGRGAMVTFKPNHVCGFLGFDRGSAVILDPNTATDYEYWPREQFLAKWRWHGGWATAVIANPVP